MLRIQRPQFLYLAAILCSLVLAFIHAGPLHGSLPALALVIVLQLYLPGWLLLRFFRLDVENSCLMGKSSADKGLKPLVQTADSTTSTQEPNNYVVRFAWILTAGLGLTITLGGIFRFLEITIPTYILLLHGLMALLVIFKRKSKLVGTRHETVGNPSGAVSSNADTNAVEITSPPKPRFQRIFIYTLLALCCLVTFIFGYQRSQLRYDGWEDQTVFVSLADWLANNPDDPGLLSRQAAVEYVDYRWLTDGWTYNHAAWVWSSGVPAATLIWYWLTPLFAWIPPLALFTLGYQLTRREDFAVYCAAGLVIAGLMTVDSLVYNRTPNAYGQNTFVQLNTLRLFSTALMLPLAQMAFVGYLNADSVRGELRSPLTHWLSGKLFIAILAAVALAFLHPRQIAILGLTVGVYAVLRWLAKPSLGRAKPSAAVFAVVIGVLALPYLQRVAILNASEQAQFVLNQVENLQADENATLPRGVMQLDNLPVLGNTLVLRSEAVFYHPLITAAVILGVALLILRWKQPEALFAGGTTLALLAIFFLPGVAELFMRIVSVRFAPTFIIALPIAIILGATIDVIAGMMANVEALYITPLRHLILIILALIILELAFEPLPIPASGRDQNRAMNEIQALRDITPADEALLAALTTPENIPQTRAVYLVPNRIANFIVESVPHALVLGGRDDGNDVGFDGTIRFYTASDQPAPFLDTQDLEYMAAWGIKGIVLRADDTRLPQMLLQPERFRLIADTGGYLAVQVENTDTDTIDELFTEMNSYFQQTSPPRWRDRRLDFAQQAVAADGWEEIAQNWRRQIAIDPGDARAQYGLAITYSLMDRDAEALILWETLHEDFPQVPLFTEALSQTHLALGHDDRVLNPLTDAMTSADANARVLAAWSLMRGNFFVDLDAETRERIVAISREDRITWDHLAGGGSDIRAGVSLLMSAGMWDAAEDWLNRLPEAERGSEDILLLAALALGRGESDRALEILRPATDPDTYAAKALRYPDYWKNNVAAQGFYLIQGELAARAGRINDAEQFYRQAIASGSNWAGRYFLARLWHDQGRLDDSEALMADISAEWRESYASDLPEFVSMMALADSGQLFVTDASVVQDNHVTVYATLGDFQPAGSPYHVREWNVEMVNPDTYAQYGAAMQNALAVDAALVRAPFEIEIAEDVPPGTPILTLVQARYNGLLIFQSLWQEFDLE